MSASATRCRTAALPLLLLLAAWMQPKGAAIETRWVLEPQVAAPGSRVQATLHVTVEGNYHVQSDKPLDEFLVPTALALAPPPGFTVDAVTYPKPLMLKVPYQEEPLSVFEHSFAIGATIQVGKDVTPGTHSIKGTLRYQACDDKKCLNPTARDVNLEIKVADAGADGPQGSAPADKGAVTAPPRDQPVLPPAHATPRDAGCDVVARLDRFTVAGTTGGYMNAEDFIAFIDGAERGTAQRNALAGRTILSILAYVFFGGLLLNLTPCVLPLIPINLAIIGAGAKSGSRKRGFALGGTYGLAMAAAYGGLGLIVILTASAFGAINSTIWFNAGIAALFVVLALAMFDVIHIDFSAWQGKLDLPGSGRKGSFALAFGMGGISALLAGACVAPVVIQVIVYAADQYARSESWALALPFILGMGMALPWPFAGAGLSLLPKPGRWMVRVKQAMGLFILFFAAYYAYGAWVIYESRSGSSQAGATQNTQVEGGWTRSICDGLAQAEKEQKLVLIDMWATWCKNCFAMDKTTLKDAEVTKRLENYVKIKFQAEDLDATPAHQMLERFEGVGLPHYAILRPPGSAPASP